MNANYIEDLTNELVAIQRNLDCINLLTTHGVSFDEVKRLKSLLLGSRSAGAVSNSKQILASITSRFPPDCSPDVTALVDATFNLPDKDGRFGSFRSSLQNHVNQKRSEPNPNTPALDGIDAVIYALAI